MILNTDAYKVELVGAYSACRGGAARSGSSPSGPSLSGNRSRPDYPEHLLLFIHLFFIMPIFSYLVTCWLLSPYSLHHFKGSSRHEGHESGS